MNEARERVLRRQFEKATEGNVLTIVRDDDLYRHIRVAKPDSYMYGFDIVTWPGYLAICGDIGDYMFARIDDMFDFFRKQNDERIDFRYWAEKLQGPGNDMGRRFTPEQMRSAVEQWLKRTAEDLTGSEALALREALEEQVFDREMAMDSETFAHYYLREFEHNGITITDAFELDLREYDPQFVSCCFAIVMGIRLYDEAKAS